MQVSPEPIHGPFIEKVRKYNPIIGNATVFEMTGDVTMYLPRKVSHGVVAAAAETTSRTEQTAPTFGNVTLRAYDHYTDQRATQQWLDSVAGSENLMLDWIYGDLAEEAEYTMVNGSGTTVESAGVFANTGASGYTIAYTAADTGVIANSDLLQMITKTHPKYRVAGQFYMTSTVLAALGNLAHPAAADTPLVSWNNGNPSLWGKPIVEVESAPAQASGTYPIFFGDLSQAYAVGIHRAISILRDPYTAAPYVRFYGLMRAGGAPWDRQAGCLLKVASS